MRQAIGGGLTCRVFACLASALFYDWNLY